LRQALSSDEREDTCDHACHGTKNCNWDVIVFIDGAKDDEDCSNDQLQEQTDINESVVEYVLSYCLLLLLDQVVVHTRIVLRVVWLSAQPIRKPMRTLGFHFEGLRDG